MTWAEVTCARAETVTAPEDVGSTEILSVWSRSLRLRSRSKPTGVPPETVRGKAVVESETEAALSAGPKVQNVFVAHMGVVASAVPVLRMVMDGLANVRSRLV